MLTPAAVARTSIPGSIGGANSASGALDALDVQAVPDLEEPVADRVPVAEQLVVARDAEVERRTQRGRRCRRVGT